MDNSTADTTDTRVAPEPVWGAPPLAPAHWSKNKTIAAVGIATVLAAGGAAVIYAADDSGGQTHGPGFGGGPGGAPGPGRGPGSGGPNSGASAAVPTALHGQFVVSDGHGGYTTELTQTGTVTEITDTAITARSEDGFTQTYVVTTDTRQARNPVQTGDTATIRATADNGRNTATAISPQR